MQLDEDTGPTRRVRVNTEGVLQSSPGAPPPFRSRKGLGENLSTGHRRVNPGRACKSTNVVYTLQEEGTVLPPDDIAPSSYRAAVNSAEGADWRDAIKTELSTLQTERRCWRYVQYPSRGTPILRCHFVFKKKKEKHLGQVVRFKARLVVDGSGQKKGVNFSETFAPVVKYATFRVFCAVCAVYGLEIHQLDVKMCSSTPLLTKRSTCIPMRRCMHHQVRSAYCYAHYTV